jgi:hypothetical protein
MDSEDQEDSDKQSRRGVHHESDEELEIERLLKSPIDYNAFMQRFGPERGARLLMAKHHGVEANMEAEVEDGEIQPSGNSSEDDLDRSVSSSVADYHTADDGNILAQKKRARGSSSYEGSELPRKKLHANVKTIDVDDVQARHRNVVTMLPASNHELRLTTLTKEGWMKFKQQIKAAWAMYLPHAWLSNAQRDMRFLLAGFPPTSSKDGNRLR